MSPGSVGFSRQALFLNDWPESEAAVYRQLATKRSGVLLDAIPMFFVERMVSVDSSPKAPPQMLSIKHTLTAQEKFALLNCRRLPARLNSSETALLLGLHDHDIALLVAAKLLFPLGKPAQNAPKYFAAADVIARAEDREWLSNVTKALARHWQVKNGRQRAVAKLAGRSSTQYASRLE